MSSIDPIPTDKLSSGEALVPLPADHAPASRPLPSRAEAFRVWLKVASLSFGGPAGQIAVMHRILVEDYFFSF
jgi:hypothetical protein